MVRRKITLTENDAVTGSKCISNGCFRKILEPGDVVDIFNMATVEGTTQQVGMCSWHHDEGMKAARLHFFKEVNDPIFESDEELEKFLSNIDL